MAQKSAKRSGGQTRPTDHQLRERSGGDRIAFDYIKSNFFRVVSVNGIVGGITPSGDIHMAVWSQRHPYPKHVVHELVDSGGRDLTLGPEVEREQREAIIRELEAGLVFNPTMARSLIAWLEARLEEFSTIYGISEEPHGEHEEGDIKSSGETGRNNAPPDGKS